jgi:hypothetical protein
MNGIKAWLCGFASTLLFHQGVLGVLYWLGQSPRAPYPMQPTAPFGVPAVFSLAFWGGVWALALYVLLRRQSGWGYWSGWLLFGALGPTLVAFLVVFPLKGLPFAAGGDPKLWLGGVILNGAWGLGVALLLRAWR